MAIDTFLEPPGSGSSEENHEGAISGGHVSAALKRWVQEDPEVAGEIQETIRAQIYLQEMDRRSQHAEQARQSAERHRGTLMIKHDPAGSRNIGLALGASLVVLLVVLDAVPLNWAAQAFGLDADGTWLVTFLLLAGSAGAILGFEVTHERDRGRGLLIAALSAGYIALAGLRTEFLVTVDGESLLVALLQSAMLTGLSAGLVLVGSAILARTRSLSLSRAGAAARRARRAAADARAARTRADEKLQRHLGCLQEIRLPWAITSAAPVGVDGAALAAALELAVRQLFPAP